MPITSRPSRPRIAESIERANRNLEPARIGWGVVDDDEHTHCRRWIRRPDRMIDDPFGQKTVRANMHPGYQNPDAIAPAGPGRPRPHRALGPVAPGRPIAVLANYSMHYYGASPVSADYYGRFATALARRIGASGPVRRAAIRRDHVAGHQRRPDVDGLRPAQEGPRPRRLCRRRRRVRRAGLPRDRPSRPGPAGHGRDDPRPGPPPARREATGLGPVDRRRDERPRPPAHSARGLRQGSDLPARRAPSRAEAPGHPDRRAGNHRDPERGLRHHRAEAQGAKPVRPRR